MNLICPFLSKSDVGYGQYYFCPGDCALWVISEEMCSFRLLADKEAEHRKRCRRVNEDAKQRGGPGP